jgi:hypothetical protein
MPNKLFNSSLRVLGLENLLCYSRDNSVGLFMSKAKKAEAEKKKKIYYEKKEKKAKEVKK